MGGRSNSITGNSTYKKVNDPRVPLTTGQCAGLCKVAPRTVSKWFDTGQLKGYRIPGSMDRRIMPTDLLEFIRRNRMPEPVELVRCVEPPHEVEVVFGTDPKTFKVSPDTVYFDDPFDMGQYVTTVEVVRAVVGDRYGLDTVAKCVRLIRSRFHEAGIVLVIADDVTIDKLESFGLAGEKRATLSILAETA